MDGLRVVAAVKSSGAETKGTRFIGITGDVEGFMSYPGQLAHLRSRHRQAHRCRPLMRRDRELRTLLSWRGEAPDRTELEPTPVVLPEEGGRAQSVRIPAEDRRSPEKRMRIARGTTQITLCNGQIFHCKVVNLSLSGAALQLDVQPAIGERVRVGRTECLAWFGIPRTVSRSSLRGPRPKDCGSPARLTMAPRRRRSVPRRRTHEYFPIILLPRAARNRRSHPRLPST